MVTYERGPRVGPQTYRLRDEVPPSSLKEVTRRSFLFTLLAAVTVGRRRSSESSHVAKFGYGGTPVADTTTTRTETPDEKQAYGAYGYGGSGY